MTGRESQRLPASLLLPAAVLALGLVLGALIFGAFFHASRDRARTIQVVGSSSERFTSDVAKWRLTLARQVSTTDLAIGYAQIHADLENVVRHLTDAGVDSSGISIQPVNAHQLWGPEGLRQGYNLVQSIYVISEDPARLEPLAFNPGSMLGPGVVLEGSYMEYYYSGIAELKHSLLAKATEDARARATEIAGDLELGPMVTGRAGVFQITEPYSTEIAAGGMYSTATKDKEISVTVHATFEVD